LLRKDEKVRVECQNCHKVFNIPDERLPEVDQISFACPSCKGNITLNLESNASSSPGPGLHTAPKPGEEDQLRGAELKAKILRTVSDLPAMPQTVMKAREIMDSPTSSFKDLGQALESDQAITARVLKVANSSYYGMGGKVASVQQAGVILGQKTLGEIVTIAGTSSLLGNSLKGYDLEPGDLWRHSLGVAFGSRIIAKKQYSHLAVDAFTAGLLHDSGKLILDPYVFEQRERFREYLTDGQRDFLSAEKEILGFDHSEIASEVCQSWDIPHNLTTAIKYHHNPSRAKDSALTYIVHVADVISMMTGLGLGMDGMTYQMDPKAMEITGINEKDISHIMAEVLESVQKMDR